jgi:hypothetical protein
LAKSLLTKIAEAHARFAAKGKTPDSIFLSQEAANRIGATDSTFMNMRVFISKQYYGDSFRIYCRYTEGMVERIA